MTYSPVNSFHLDIARGAITGYSFINKYGRNDDIGTGVSEEVWAGGGNRAYLSSAETMDIASTSTADDGSPVGTGARTMTIQGLDANFDEISEDITLDGTTVVATVNSYLRIHRAFVVTAGSAGSNVGMISVDPTTSGSGSRQGTIEAGDGQTLISHYTVPRNKTAYVVGQRSSIGSETGTAGAKEVKILRFIRENADANGAWKIQGQFATRSDGGSQEESFAVPQPIPGKSDIKFVAVAENNKSSVYVQYSLILIDD